MNVFVVDDDPEIQTLLKTLYGKDAHETRAFLTGAEALAALREPAGRKCDLVICDLMLPDLTGLELIERLLVDKVDVPVVLITANATVETAAQALQKGAFDYIAKPINYTELRVISARAIEHRKLVADYRQLQERLRRANSLGELVGKSPKMKKVFELIERVAPSASSVLVTGESGTGKEMVARAIHDRSSRKAAPFVAINCTAIPDTLLESELFGHKRGSFTGANEDRKGLFEAANGGTVFLDEIGDMPLALQAKLLRVIQERQVKPVGDNVSREIDVRLIAATHNDLRKAVADGKFREDLYYRLCVFPIEIPPLRERPEDIPLLVEHFLAEACATARLPARTLTQAALSKLMRMRWRGNVRELQNTMERAVLLSDRPEIDDCHVRVESADETDKHVETLFSGLPSLEQLEKEYIRHVLAHTGGKREASSELLGINRKTLYRKLRDYGLSSSEDDTTD